MSNLRTLAPILLTLCAAGAGAPCAAGQAVAPRDGLANSRAAFEAGRGRVAFLGGSITEADGWRRLVGERLQERFPDCRFTSVAAGLASTGSTTGEFRLQRDVLTDGCPDLLFVEAAVNDDQDEQLSETEAVRGMEGIVRHVRTTCPNTDVVLVHFVNPGILEALQHGRTPVSIAAHERVAERYGAPSVNVAAALAAGGMTWDEYGGTHPNAAGHAFAAGLVDRLFENAWRKPSPKPTPHRLPEPIDARSYAGGRLIAPERLDGLETAGGFAVAVPDWKTIPGDWREPFRDKPLLAAERPGATASFGVVGSTVGAFLLAGPDAGIVEVTIDDTPPQAFDLRHDFSAGLHYPRTIVFASGLSPHRHSVRLRVMKRDDGQPGGNAVRIVAVAAEGPQERPVD